MFNGATRSQIVTVPIPDDTVVENQFEQFFINLREYESAVILSGPTASVTIEDNDSELSMNICTCQIVSLLCSQLIFYFSGHNWIQWKL